MTERNMSMTFQFSFSYSTVVGEDAKTLETRKEKKSRTNLTPDDIRARIWKAAATDRRYPQSAYYQIMEYLCCKYKVDCVESLRKENYGSFIKELEEGAWRR